MFTNIFMKRKRWNWNSYFHKSNRMKKKKKSFCARRWWRRLHLFFLTTITGFRCCYIAIIYYKMIYMFIHSFIVTWKAKNDLILFLYNIVCIYTNSANWNVHEKNQVRCSPWWHLSPDSDMSMLFLMIFMPKSGKWS